MPQINMAHETTKGLPLDACPCGQGLLTEIKPRHGGWCVGCLRCGRIGHHASTLPQARDEWNKCVATGEWHVAGVEDKPARKKKRR